MNDKPVASPPPKLVRVAFCGALVFVGHGGPTTYHDVMKIDFDQLRREIADA